MRILDMKLTALVVLLCGCGISDNDRNPKCQESISASFALTSEDTWVTGSNRNINTARSTISSPGDSKSIRSDRSDLDCISAKRMESAPVDAMAPESESMRSDSEDMGVSKSATEEISASSGSPSKGGGGAAGILTAGTFDDSLNLESFKKYWEKVDSKNQNPWLVEPTDYNWPAFDDLNIVQRYQNSSEKPVTLELLFVVDATGSMSDELNYIKKELQNISSTTKENYQSVNQKFSLIVYRDVGDQFITSGIQFTDDLDKFQKFLNKQYAGGGGDYPEAMHTALEEADSKLQWGGDDTTKMLFLIADAPPHGNQVSKTIEAVDNLKDKGVHIFPVAASGVADLAEKVMRYAAVTTGGEYIFITDDSGVGNPHIEPHIPCYHVRKLNQIMIELISSELSGARIESKPDDIIRTVGNPQNGRCMVSLQ